MTVASIVALYFIAWWLTLFAVLPLWVRSQHEAGEVTEGTEPGAPTAPLMWRKLLLTSVLAVPVAAGVYWVITSIE